jgi:lipopolysaccharide export system protein LptA
VEALVPRLEETRGLFVAAMAMTVAGVALGPGTLAAQDGCIFGEDGNDVLRQVTMTGGEAIFYVTRPHLVCEGGIQIWADSAEAFTASNLTHLIGSVRYEDPTRTLVSDEARYFSQVGRLQAEGGLRVDDRDQGSTIENGALVYLRRTEFRPQESMTVTRRPGDPRPRATVSGAADSSSTSDEDRVYVVVGDRIVSSGGDRLSSTGSVEVAFDSVLAYADTLEYDEITDRLELLGSARVDAPKYDLTGRRIELTTPNPGRREVRAIEDGSLSGEDLRLTAERILLFLREDRMERLVALPTEGDSAFASDPAAASSAAGASPPTPEARPRAVAETFEITADSLDILAPDERLERVFAAGRARSVSTDRDSLTVASLPDIAKTDWLEGDTIVVTFVTDVDPAATADTIPGVPQPDRESQVDRIVAIVDARSLYRLSPSDPAAVAGEDPPAVHYVVGDRITIVMQEGQVDRLEVEGQTTGIHLEPLPRGGTNR